MSANGTSPEPQTGDKRGAESVAEPPAKRAKGTSSVPSPDDAANAVVAPVAVDKRKLVAREREVACDRCLRHMCAWTGSRGLPASCVESKSRSFRSLYELMANN